MKINTETVGDFRDKAERFSEKVLKLTGSGDSGSNIIFLQLSKGLLGASGEFITPGMYRKFKANGKLNKLKSQSTFDTATTGKLEVNAGPGWSSWKFIGGDEKFTMEFSNYKNSRFTIQKEYIEKASAILWSILGKTLDKSLLASSGTGGTEFHRDELQNSVSSFTEAPVLENKSLKAGDPYGLFTSLISCFGRTVAGFAISSADQVEEFTDLFLQMDRWWADILDRFLNELNRHGSGLKNSRHAIDSTGDMFCRLSALWYLRTLITLNFANHHVDRKKYRTWSPSILMPRAMDMAGKQLPELSPFPDTGRIGEEIARLRAPLPD